MGYVWEIYGKYMGKTGKYVNMYNYIYIHIAVYITVYLIC